MFAAIGRMAKDVGRTANARGAGVGRVRGRVSRRIADARCKKCGGIAACEIERGRDAESVDPSMDLFWEVIGYGSPNVGTAGRDALYHSTRQAGYGPKSREKLVFTWAASDSTVVDRRAARPA